MFTGDNFPLLLIRVIYISDHRKTEKQCLESTLLICSKTQNKKPAFITNEIYILTFRVTSSKKYLIHNTDGCTDMTNKQ